MAKIVIETELSTKSFEKQISELQAKIKELDDIIKEPKKYGFSSEDIKKAEIDVEKLTNSLYRLQEQQRKLSLSKVSNIGYNQNNILAGGYTLSNGLVGRALGDLGEKTEWVADNVKDLNNAFEETGTQGEQAAEKTSAGFERGIRSLKRFALGLFGIQSAFGILRRATNTYLSQNEETANKMNAIWTALGNALAPIIETIANAVLKLVGYIQVFLNALGWKVDLTKNMDKNTKSIQGTSKAMKDLNRQVASFDEMNVQQKGTSSSGIGGVSGGTGSFQMPELDPRIVKTLQDLAHWLRENWDWIWKVGAALAGVFGIAKIGGWLSNIGKLIGNDQTGILGLTGMLKGLLALELITITIAIVYYSQELKKVKQDNEDIVKWNKSITKENDKVNKSNLEKIKTYEKGSKAINDYTSEIIRQIDAEYDSITAHQKQNDEMSILDNIFDVFGGTRAKNNELTKESTQRIIDNVAKLQELAKEGKLTDDQMKVYNQTMAKLTKTQESMTPFIEWNSWAFDKQTLELYNQIKALKENEKQFSTTTSKNKNNVLDIYNFTKTKFSEMNKLKATPTVEFKANTKKLTDVFDTLINSVAVDDGVRGAMTATSKLLKKLGLAQGGIVNLPGRGVPITNVVGGEATGGAEGVVPLNNEESMDLIGQAVAKHTAINLTINTLLDGKVIAREQKTISNNVDFATNGRGIL